jgi:L,D-transpeptidase-like protein
MRLHRVALPFAAALAAFTLAQPARANVMIIIDKAEQKMTVTVNGEDRYVWPVSTGRDSYDTPSGEFQPFRMERDHYSREWDDAPMPHSIFFTKIGHAIHGSYETKRLGTPASHGCVRLSPQNAATLFALVKDEGVFNTLVRLKGEIPQTNDLVARRGRDSDRYASRGRNNGGDRIDAENGSTDDDAAAALPPQRNRQARGWRESRDGFRTYYYRERPYFERRSYGRGLFFPFGF